MLLQKGWDKVKDIDIDDEDVKGYVYQLIYKYKPDRVTAFIYQHHKKVEHHPKTKVKEPFSL